MLLCEETIGQYPTHLLTRGLSTMPVTIDVQGGDGSDGTFSVNKDKEVLPDSVLAKFGNIHVPKNKAARRRLAQDIKDNVDKINRGTQFKRKGAPVSPSIQRAIRQVTR